MEKQKRNEADTKIPLIYILGNSHSGSTLISFLIGGHPEIEYVGEIKLKTRHNPYHQVCTCGQNWKSCPFWGSINEQIRKLKEPLFTDRDKRSFFQKVFLGIKTSSSSNTINHLDIMYDLLQDQAMQLNSNTRYILDSSKSIWMLDHWRKVDGLDIKIVWVERTLGGNVYSFLKRKHSFSKSLSSVLFNNHLIQKYLKRHRLAFYKLSDHSLSADYTGEMDKLSSFLGIDLSEIDVQKKKYHVLTGNGGTKKQFVNGFEGFRMDEKWKDQLSVWQFKMIKLFSK